MLRKFQRKADLIRKLFGIGADIPSGLQLVCQLIVLSLGRYVGFVCRPFSSRVRVKDQTSRMYFAGTMGELLTLVDIFADTSYEPDRTADHTLFKESPRTVLDLGANIGIASVWFLLSYPNVTLDAYEPNPDMFALLEKNLKSFERVHAYQEAITDKDGSVSFNRSKYALESSIFSARESEAFIVPAASLDSAIERIGGSVDILKLDIEGAEFDALRHSQKLKAVRAIVGEAHTEQSGHPQTELSELLSSFNLVRIYNPNNDTVFGLYAARTISI